MKSKIVIILSVLIYILFIFYKVKPELYVGLSEYKVLFELINVLFSIKEILLLAGLIGILKD